MSTQKIGGKNSQFLGLFSQVMSAHNRYNNQLRVNNFSEEDQKRLQDSEVLVVGAGGLGCPLLLQLAALGVGHITLVDDDVVNESNLNRQTLFTPKDVGQKKVAVAAQKILEFNPLIEVLALEDRLTSKNASALIDGKKVVIDCTDNIPARYVMDKVCKEQGIPMVFGGVRMLEGQFGVFNYRGGPSFNDLFPAGNRLEQLEDCNTLGTFGFACQLVAGYQANEAFKVLLNREYVQSGRIWTIDLETGSIFKVGNN